MPKPQHVDDKLYVIIALLWFFFSDGLSRTEVVVVVVLSCLYEFLLELHVHLKIAPFLLVAHVKRRETIEFLNRHGFSRVVL